MTAPLDIAGRRFGRLVAIQRTTHPRKRTPWLLECDCGNTVVAALDNLRSGYTKSCGCLRVDVTRQRSLTHGHRVGRKTSRTRKAYEHAKSRCNNPNNPKYPNYGGRGIRMCEEWLTSFDAFLRDMGECPSDRTLDRVDVNGHYEPRNCRWATTSQQARTRTDNVLVEHDGRKMVLKDFAALMGVNYKSLHRCVKYLGDMPHEAVEKLKS